MNPLHETNTPTEAEGTELGERPAVSTTRQGRRRAAEQMSESRSSASETARPRWFQGVQYYYDADENSAVPGLMHVKFGQYHVRDVKFVAAFDVDAKKVGFDLSEAIFASENNTIKIADVPLPTNVTVQRGPTLDGTSASIYAETIEISDTEAVDVVKKLREAKVDVLVSYLRPRASSEEGRQVLRPVRHRRGCGVRQRAAGVAPPPTRCGPRSSPTRACRSSATTSRARSVRRSPTA